MSRERDISITLTGNQVARVVRDASGRAGMTALLSGPSSLQELHGILLPLLSDNRVSRSTVRALLVLSAFPSDGTYREVTEVPKQLGLSQSTTHRYVRTWVALGLLEQDPGSRRYRRPPANGQAATGQRR